MNSICFVCVWVGTTFAALPLLADAVSFGVKAGVPITAVVKTSGEIGSRPFEAVMSRFTVGPILNIGLPHRFGLEAGAMYKRFDQNAGQVRVIAEPGTPYRAEITPYSHDGASWEFPLTGQYRFSGGFIRPYVEAGVSFNRLSGILTPFRTLASQSTVLTPAGRSEWRTGAVIGGGFEVKSPLLRIVPGLRYTRYGDTEPLLPAANSVDVLVGIVF